jgi:prepilin-type processing-associated H-X9-DG protein
LGGRPDHLEYRRLIEFTRPSDVLAFSDACGVAAAPGIVLYKGCAQESFAFRHRRRANVAWLDGHVSPAGKDDVPFGMQHRYEAFWSARGLRIGK